MPRRLAWREFIDAVLAPINDGLETRSHLFIFLKDRFQGLLIKRFGLTALEIPTELRRDQAASPRWAADGRYSCRDRFCRAVVRRADAVP